MMNARDLTESVRTDLRDFFQRGPHPESPLYLRLCKRKREPDWEARDERRHQREIESENAYNCPRGEYR